MDFFSLVVDFILHFDKYLTGFIDAYGALTYGILFLIIFCETGLVFTPFLPGDSLIFAAGAIAASTGSLSVWILWALLFAASVAGDNSNYRIGRFLGARVLAHKKIPLVKPEHIEKTQGFFDKYGVKTIVIAKFLPIVRTFSPFVAGVGHMKFRRFLLFDLIGGFAWVSLFLWMGFFFGNLPFVKKNFELVIIAIILVSLAPTVWHLAKSRIDKSRAKKAERAAAGK
jgi:membrane-associated protein